MTTSQSSTTGCISSVLRRLLCAGGGLPTHPDNNPNQESALKTLQVTSSPTIPAGVIARLMGLDSFPKSPKQPTNNKSIMQKSKSVGSLNFLPNFTHSLHQNPSSHRRSVSLREAPTPLLLHDDDPDTGLTPIPEKSNKSQSQHERIKVKNEGRKRGSVKKKKQLVDDGFPVYKSRSRRYNHPMAEIINNGKHERKVVKKKSTLSEEEYCIKVLEEVCRLTVAEIKGCVWMDTTKVVNNNINLQDLSYEISQQILRLLVYEMVDELYV